MNEWEVRRLIRKETDSWTGCVLYLFGLVIFVLFGIIANTMEALHPGALTETLVQTFPWLFTAQ